MMIGVLKNQSLQNLLAHSSAKQDSGGIWVSTEGGAGKRTVAFCTGCSYFLPSPPGLSTCYLNEALPSKQNQRLNNTTTTALSPESLWGR